ncbi:hypothetical protein GOP47_0022119, partial [Adiantum capillus-veneris]
TALGLVLRSALLYSRSNSQPLINGKPQSTGPVALRGAGGSRGLRPSRASPPASAGGVFRQRTTVQPGGAGALASARVRAQSGLHHGVRQQSAHQPQCRPHLLRTGHARRLHRPLLLLQPPSISC